MFPMIGIAWHQRGTEILTMHARTSARARAGRGNSEMRGKMREGKNELHIHTV